MYDLCSLHWTLPFIFALFCVCPDFAIVAISSSFDLRGYIRAISQVLTFITVLLLLSFLPVIGCCSEDASVLLPKSLYGKRGFARVVKCTNLEVEK